MFLEPSAPLLGTKHSVFSPPQMAVHRIRTYGDPVLRTVAAPVEIFDDVLNRLVDDMIETMYAAPGVGLAAPQIGISRQITVFDSQDGDGARVLINPVLLETSGEFSYDEGCLSVPGHYWAIVRPAFVHAAGVDQQGRPVEYVGEELLGRVLQHEIDHLHGNLLVERLDRKTRKLALKELREEALGLTET